MLCKNYDDLSHVEKIIYIGELIHACQSDDHFFNLGELIIGSAKTKGTLDGVVILPEVNYEEGEKDAKKD
jgi:hypothetical protein